MPNVLEVKIIGDVTDLQKSLKQAESLQAQYTASIEKTSNELKESISVTAGYKKAIEDLNAAFKSGSISSKEYSKQLANLKRDEKEAQIATADLRKELSNLKREQKELGTSFDTAAKKTANGGNALMQFSRIAQDAPYGIIGIGNNITATVEAFGHLQRQTGSTGGALKALASSIVGSGGILLAVSLLTTGLTVMAQKGLSVGDVFDMLTGNFDENAKALKDLNKEVAKTAGEEIAVMKALISTAQDDTLSREKRLLAVKKLQDEYPSYFGNLKQEQILNGDVSKAVDDVSRALIARARASAIAGKLGENAAKRLDLEEKREKAILDIQKAQKGLREDTGTFSKSFNKTDLNVALKTYKDIVAEINKLDASSRKYSEQEAKATKESIGLLETETEAEKALAEARRKAKEEKERQKKIKDPIIEFKTELKPVLDVEKTTEALIEVRNEFGKLQEKVIKFEEIQPVPITITAKVSEDFIENLEKADKLAEKYAKLTGEKLILPDNISADYLAKLEFALGASELAASGIGSAFNALGSDLAKSLETGNSALDAFVGSVIQGLAQVAAAQLTGLIAKQAVATTSLSTDAAVATGNAVVAATETASATGPAAAFVLPALVGAAIGFIAAAFSGIKFAHGGIVPGGSFTGDKIPAMLNSGETVMNSQQQANTLMAIANGNSNALQGNVKIDTFKLDTVLRGSDLLLAIKREEKKR
ncbi:hypothetical protein D3C86_657130 [compost metagenome]